MIVFVHLKPLTELKEVHEFGTFKDFNLPKNDNINLAIDLGDLDTINDNQKSKAMDLLLKYKHIFAENDSDLGMAQEFHHQIHLEDPNPIRQRAIRRSPASEAIVEEEISKLVEKGLLIPSKSPWASPVLIVKKKDGTN